MAVSAHYIPLHDANDDQDGEGVWKGNIFCSVTID